MPASPSSHKWVKWETLQKQQHYSACFPPKDLESLQNGKTIWQTAPMLCDLSLHNSGFFKHFFICMIFSTYFRQALYSWFTSFQNGQQTYKNLPLHIPFPPISSMSFRFMPSILCLEKTMAQLCISTLTRSYGWSLEEDRKHLPQDFGCCFRVYNKHMCCQDVNWCVCVWVWSRRVETGNSE